MKNINKILLIISIICVIIGIIIYFISIKNNENDRDVQNIIAQDRNNLTESIIEKEENVVKVNKEDNGKKWDKNSVTKKLIVVKVEEKSLKTMDYNEELDIIHLKNEDTSKFKQGQEILIYYDGIVLTSYPGQIYADKVEILKDKSDIEIPIEILRYYNFSQKNISAEIENFSNTKMEFTIKDENKYSLEYGEDFSYIILKKNVENEKYNENLEFDYDSYTPPTATTTSSYSPEPNRLKKVWEELEIIGEGNNENCKWEDVSDGFFKLKGICDWTELYGQIEEGEYQLKVTRKKSEDDSFFRNIIVNFKVNEFGSIDYEKPEFSW